MGKFQFFTSDSFRSFQATEEVRYAEISYIGIDWLNTHTQLCDARLGAKCNVS